MFDRLDPSFEPSSQTKEAMLFVRTHPRLLGGIRHPGLFGIHGYTADWVLFVVALLLETAGLFALFNSMSQGESASFAATLLIVAALFMVDLLLAFFHHRYSTGINARLEIESTLWSKTGGTEGIIVVERNADHIRRRKRIAFILSIVLLLAAALKVMLINGLSDNDESRQGVVIFISVAYFVTALIHIKITGYLIHAGWAQWLHSRDIEAFKKSNGEACVASNHVIELPPFPDFQKPISVQTHSVVMDHKPGSGETVYQLRCYGLLLDKEIEEFANKIVDKEARSEFVLKAMELQVRMI